MGWLHKAHMWQTTSLKLDRDNHWKILMQAHGHTYTHALNLTKQACDLHRRAAVNIPVMRVCGAAGM